MTSYKHTYNNRIYAHPQQSCNNDCSIRLSYNTLPTSARYAKKFNGPTNILHHQPRIEHNKPVYDNISNFSPHNSMYSGQGEQFLKIKNGTCLKRISYGYQTHPLTDVYVRELPRYSPIFSKLPDF